MAINPNYPPSGSTPITQKNRKPFQDAPNPFAPKTPDLSNDQSAAFSLTKPSEVPANPSRDNAQPFNLTPFTFAVAEKVATAANERMLSYDVMGQALKGKTPMEYFDELENKVIDVTTTNENKTNDIKKLEDDIKNLRPPQADDSAYRAAMDAFNNLATQAPMAPTLERLNVSDTDKIMLGFALLTGANPNDAIGNFIKVKQGFVDQSNEQAMGQYKLDTTNFGNQIDAAGTRLTNERQSLNDTQQSLNNQYNTRLDAMNSAANRLALNGRTEEANIQDGMYKASMAVNRKYIAQGIYTQADYNKDAQAAIDNGFDPERMIWPPINVPTAAKSNMDFDNALNQDKFDLSVVKQEDLNAFRSLGLLERSRQFDDKLKQGAAQFKAKFGFDMSKEQFKQWATKQMLGLRQQGIDIQMLNTEIAGDNSALSGAKTLGDLQGQITEKTRRWSEEEDPIKKQVLFDELETLKKQRANVKKALEVRPTGKAASVRTSNPGAMWLSPLAKKWGASGKQNLNDGTGQGNNIAVFPNALNGFAAQFDLLNQNYTGKSLRQAINTWSGGNNVNEYLAHIQQETGMNPETFLSRELLAGEGGLMLVKAMAKHEAGGNYPVSDDVIRAAQPLGISGKPDGKQESAPSVIAGAGQTKNPSVKVVIDGKGGSPTPNPPTPTKPPGTSPNAGKGQPEKGGKPVPNKVNIPGTNITKSK